MNEAKTTTESLVINPDTLAPLFEPWEEPNSRREPTKADMR